LGGGKKKTVWNIDAQAQEINEKKGNIEKLVPLTQSKKYLLPSRLPVWKGKGNIYRHNVKEISWKAIKNSSA